MSGEEAPPARRRVEVGPYGGAFSASRESASESVRPGIADGLPHGPAPTPLPTGLVAVRATSIGDAEHAGSVEYSGDLEGLAPLAPGAAGGEDAEKAWRAFGTILEALDALHATGREHGDLRLAHAWTGDRTVLTCPAQPLADPGKLLRERFADRHADPADVAFVAPEVLAGGPASRASDVFAAGAMAFALATGRVPLGQLDFEDLPLELGSLVRRSLAASPASRPPLAALRSAVAAVAATGVASLTAPPAAAPPAAPPAVAAPAPASAPAPSAVAPAPAPSAAAALTGFLADAAASRPSATAAAATGSVAGAASPARSAPASSTPAPATVAAAVTGAAAAARAPSAPGASGPAPPRVRLVEAPVEPGTPKPAEERRDNPVILSCLLVVAGIFTFVGALWLAIFEWKDMPAFVQMGVLLALTAGGAVGGVVAGARGYARSGGALIALATQLLWADGGFLLQRMDLADKPGPWSLLAAAITAVTVGLAIKRRSIALVVLSVCSAGVALGTFGAATGEAGWLAVALATTGGFGLGGFALEANGWKKLGRFLLYVATRAFWPAELLALDLAGVKIDHGVVIAGTVAGMGLVTLALGWRLRSIPLAVVAGLDLLGAAWIFGAATNAEGRLGVSLALAGIAAGGGFVLERRENPRAALALYGVASQLLWLVGLFALQMRGLDDHTGGWCVVAALVTLVTTGLAAWRRSPVLAFVAVGGALVMAGTFGATYGDPAWLACLVVATVGLAVAGRLSEQRGDADSGLLLLGLASLLVWGVGALVIHMEGLWESPEAWATAGAFGTLATYGLALARRSSLLSTLGSMGATFTMGALGLALRTGHEEGPAIWSLVTALALAGLAGLGQWRGGDEVGAPPAVVATLAAIVSGLVCGLGGFVAHPHDPFFAVWPYVVAAIAGGLAWGTWRAPAMYARLAAVVAGLCLLATPTLEALVQLGALAYQYATTLAGGALIVAAFQWPGPGSAGDDESEHRGLVAGRPTRILVTLVGLVHVTLAPTIAALWKLGGKDGDVLARELSGLSAPELLGHPLFYLSYVLGTAGVLVGLGVLFGRGAERKTPYRILEVAGSLLFFGLLTGLSLLRLGDVLYPAILFAGGFAILAAGVLERHVLLVFIAGGFLSVNAWVQYFGKLHEVLPLGLLMIGFGVGVFASAIFFEKKIKPFLPEMKKWA